MFQKHRCLTEISRENSSCDVYKPSTTSPLISDSGSLARKQIRSPNSQKWMSEQAGGTWRPDNQLQQGQEPGFDSQHVNKGYSSVAIQNVHALGRLPHMLDGTTDGQQRSAKTLLAAATKVRSPMLVHRPSPTSGAWYGPHSREVHSNSSGIGNVVNGDNRSRTGMHKSQS